MRCHNCTIEIYMDKVGDGEWLCPRCGDEYYEYAELPSEAYMESTSPVEGGLSGFDCPRCIDDDLIRELLWEWIDGEGWAFFCPCCETHFDAADIVESGD